MWKVSNQICTHHEKFSEYTGNVQFQSVITVGGVRSKQSPRISSATQKNIILQSEVDLRFRVLVNKSDETNSLWVDFLWLGFASILQGHHS